jgi:hypothetical protein
MDDGPRMLVRRPQLLDHHTRMHFPMEGSLVCAGHRVIIIVCSLIEEKC